MEETHELVTVDQLCDRVYTIRGQQVMLDYDLAEIYGYEVKRLNEKTDKRGTNIKKLPYAFTEQGVYMLATVLRGKLAEQQSIFIMRAFREMRHYIKQNQQFVTQPEVDYLSAGGSSIYVVDDYMNTKTLQLLSQKKQGVEVILFTENGHGKKGFLTEAVINDFACQYPTLRIKSNPDCHDRWIVLDYGLSTEQVYHCGASSKDAGKKLCATLFIRELGRKLQSGHVIICEKLYSNDEVGK